MKKSIASNLKANRGYIIFVGVVMTLLTFAMIAWQSNAQVDTLPDGRMRNEYSVMPESTVQPGAALEGGNAQPAILGTAGASNAAVVFPNTDFPNTQSLVPGLPAGASPHGVSYFGADNALLSDFNNSRIFVVRISTASLVSTINTGTAPAYTGTGTIAVAPNLTAALAMGGNTTLHVIQAPFGPSSARAQVNLPGTLGTAQTQAIVFNNAGRAFVYHTVGISVLDAPYTSVAFTIPVAGNSVNAITGALAISPDGNTLLATNGLSGNQIRIFQAPFSASSVPTILTVTNGGDLDGIACTPDGTKAIVVSSNPGPAGRVFAISAPFSASSTVDPLPLPAGIGPSGFEDVGISADSQTAILTGRAGAANDLPILIRAPFTASGSQAFAIPVQNVANPSRGAGSVRFLPPGLAPGLTISKSAPATVPSGSTLTYTISYSNTGTANASNVFIKDPLPAGTSFVSATGGGTLSAGRVVFNIGTVNAGSGTQTRSFTVTVNTPSGGTVNNTGYTIEGTGISPIPGPPVSTAVTGSGGPTPTPTPGGNTVTVTVTPASAQENGPDTFLYVFRRSVVTADPLIVQISGAGSTATINSDYTVLSGPISSGGGAFNGMTGTVTIPANVDSAGVRLDPTDDQADEQTERIRLTILSGSGYTPGNPSVAEALIFDNDSAPTTTTITSDNPDPSTIGQAVVVNYSVIASGGGTPTGNVTITASGGPETCTGPVAQGMCTIILTTGGARTLTATYTGDATFGGSTDPEPHQVDAGTSCAPMPIDFGRSFSGLWNAQSCVADGRVTDSYSFNGMAGQQIAMTLTSPTSVTALQLLAPSGMPVDSVSGENGTRLPADGFLTLTANGMYTIRAQGFMLPAPGIESLFGGMSATYTVSLFRQRAEACSYVISPAETEVTPSGGNFFFDVTTAPGCPPLPAPASSGPFFNITSYVSGRVAFNVQPNPNRSQRTTTITVGTLTHSIRQFGQDPPSNDPFENPESIVGPMSTLPVRGFNTTASQQIIAGEPTHVPNTSTPFKSIWYRWFGPDNSLYSFNTSGSSFDTVLAIYLCPATGTCTFANMTRVGSSDDAAPFDRSSTVNFRAVAGRDYRIVIDGKDNAIGTSQLSWSRYRRLFRLYLQNHNGFPATTTPTSVRAISGNSIVNGNRISQGVYEFNIPNDTLAYTVNIEGPSGIVWNPNNLPLENQVESGEGVRCDGPEGGNRGQNVRSYPECADGCFLEGFIRNIAPGELPTGDPPQPQMCPNGSNCLEVRVGYSSAVDSSGQGSVSHRDSQRCTISRAERFGGVDFAKYTCPSRPEAMQDILPSIFGKEFKDPTTNASRPIYRYPNIVLFDTDGSTVFPRFDAETAPTFNISGSVQATGCTDVELSYAPVPARPAERIIVRGKTDPATGQYQFPNLRPNSYSVKAIKQGVTFSPLAPVEITNTNRTVDISQPLACVFEAMDVPSLVPASGGPQSFRIRTNDARCTVIVNESEPWLTISAVDGQVDTRVDITAQPKFDAGSRTGIIRIAGSTTTIPITQAGGFDPGLEGDLITRPRGDRNFTAADSQQFKRFIAGLDAFDNTTSNEFQRTDTAPLDSLGDGRINAADQQQVNNYIAGISTPRTAGGEQEPSLGGPAEPLSESEGRVYRIVSTRADRSGYLNASVELDARGNETALTFSLNFDPARLAIAGIGGTDVNPDVTRGDGVPAGTSITVNALQSNAGVIGVLVDAGRAIAPGTRQIVNFRFRIRKDSEPGVLAFSDDSLPRSTTNAAAESLGAIYAARELGVSMVRRQPIEPAAKHVSHFWLLDRYSIFSIWTSLRGNAKEKRMEEAEMDRTFPPDAVAMQQASADPHVVNPK